MRCNHQASSLQGTAGQSYLSLLAHACKPAFDYKEGCILHHLYGVCAHTHHLL